MDTRACHMIIHDNGNGAPGDEGNGICGMRERVRALGGTLAFESERGKGTRVRISVPLTSTGLASIKMNAITAGTEPLLTHV